jgi:predicted adenine nucleotide alpha hydrolase (AANH) superfamily ATPase
MKVLIHTCCAPCLVYPLEKLSSEGHQATAFWYNPNIHPYTEYKKRMQSLKEFEKTQGIEVIYRDSYDLEEHLRRIMSDLENRCMECYRLRLEATAECAQENGFEAFTTTLLVSPYQKHDWIKAAGKEMASKYGVEYIHPDFASGYREGHDKAYHLGLYMQKYCGCVFSEKERYQKKKKKKLPQQPA